MTPSVDVDGTSRSTSHSHEKKATMYGGVTVANTYVEGTSTTAGPGDSGSCLDPCWNSAASSSAEADIIPRVKNNAKTHRPDEMTKAIHDSETGKLP